MGLMKVGESWLCPWVTRSDHSGMVNHDGSASDIIEGSSESLPPNAFIPCVPEQKQYEGESEVGVKVNLKADSICPV